MTAVPHPTEPGSNLARLYRITSAAARDRSGWWRRHCEAITLPFPTFERALVHMLEGWLLYADAHRSAFESGIGEDRVLGPEWAAIGAALRGLLNGELGRLDGGTLDGILCDTLTANGVDPETI